MKKQILRISPHQSSKVMAALYVVMMLPFAVIGGIGLLFAENKTTMLMFLFAPLIYGIVGYLLFALFFWLYNVIASQIGGVEFEVKDLPDRY